MQNSICLSLCRCFIQYTGIICNQQMSLYLAYFCQPFIPRLMFVRHTESEKARYEANYILTSNWCYFLKSFTSYRICCSLFAQNIRMEMSAAAQLTKQTCMYALERKYSNLPHRLLMCIWCLLPRDANVEKPKHMAWYVF